MPAPRTHTRAHAHTHTQAWGDAATPVAQKADIWKIVINFAAAMCGFIGAFVLFTTEASANPGHPFYESVMTSIALGGNTAMLTFVGLAYAEPLLIEIGVMLSGFFGLFAAVHLHQLETFATLPAVAPFFPADGVLESLAVLEMNRYRTAATLFELAAILTVVGACLFLKGNTEATIASPIEAPGPIRYGLIGFSGLLVFIGAICSWSTVGHVLDDSIDAGEADDSRADAANEYIFLMLVAWFCFAIQGFAPLKSLSPLVYLGYGICLSVVTGLTNVGTHDRQLWMIDYSLAGLNELRVFMSGEDGHDDKRAFNIEDSKDWYQTALAGVLCTWIGMITVYFASFGKPMGGKFAAFKTSVPGLGLTAVSLLTGMIGCIMLWSLDSASPPIRAAALSDVSPDLAAGVTDACKGSTFNIALTATEAGCFANAQEAAGERFSLNTFGLGSVYSGEPYGQYTIIFFFTAVSFMVQMATLYPVVGGDPRGLKAGLFMTGFLWFAICYAMIWGVNPAAGKYTAETCDDGEDTECTVWKTGFTFLWFQGVTATVAFVLLLQAAETAPAEAYAEQANAEPANADDTEAGVDRKPSIRQSSI